MTPYEQIVAIIDAAGPPPDPAALEALSEQASAERGSRGRKDKPAGAVNNRPAVSSSFQEEADQQPSHADECAPPPFSSLEGDRDRAATLAGFGGDLDAEQPIENALAYCAGLGENDVDNGVRLRCYLGRDLLAIAQAGEEVGAFLNWSGRHWDIDGGSAGVHILAQRVGDLITREADYMTSSPFERDQIAAGEEAKRDSERLAGELADIDSGDKSETAKARRAAIKAKIKELSLVVRRGGSSQGALLVRKINRRDFGNQSKNMARVRHMLGMAGPHVRHPPEAFNADQLLVATLTHTLRFARVADEADRSIVTARVSAIAEHRRSDMLTAMVPVPYVQDAKPDKWQQFLDRCMPHLGKRKDLQVFSGLGLLGIPVQRLMFHYGSGANGKSVFLEVITRLLGDSFAVGLPVESITGMTAGSGSAASPDIARLFGKRMLRVHELPQGALLKAEVIKKLTGGERMTARDLYKGFFEFQPIAKPHMSGNDYPSWDGSDGGMKRRIILMHWDVTIPDGLKPGEVNEQRDFEEFVTDLLSEGPAILNWLIAGALEYLQNGLVLDKQVRADTASYADEMDPVGQFVGHCLLPADGHHEKARDVYLAYKAWSEANARRVMTETRFGKILKKKIPFDDTKRIRLYLNVRLHDVPEGAQDQNVAGTGGQGYGPRQPPWSGDDVTF